MKLAVLFLLATLPAWGQTSASLSNPPVKILQAETNLDLSSARLTEQVRTACISGRRCICGKILEIFPDGVVVESGYTNLLRAPLTSSWLVPGTVVASRAVNLLESAEPGSVCLDTVYLTDYPKSKKLKPKRYDYVIIEGYPAGQYTYTPLGTVHKTVRRFSAQLSKAVELNIQVEQNTPSPDSGAK
jgi:hypothetical protein